jgi:RNA polymerase subunit RPABC4/transcription elongation factor Spt4
MKACIKNKRCVHGKYKFCNKCPWSTLTHRAAGLVKILPENFFFAKIGTSGDARRAAAEVRYQKKQVLVVHLASF